ncbi:unnamed protein product [Soboliphyme baturini]|uniref:Transposase n=1 Tax=Soboliphyme baturini TaxID=241478 RepID=A0A183ILC2_9BILA|nr:unnamed protein product [Soboliphyme baturini]
MWSNLLPQATFVHKQVFVVLRLRLHHLFSMLALTLEANYLDASIAEFWAGLPLSRFRTTALHDSGIVRLTTHR